MRFPTASRLERALACPASEALPKVYTETKWAADGTRLHDTLKAAMQGGPRDAWVEACFEVAPEVLTHPGVVAEPAYLWDVEWGRGELVGVDIGRNYGSATSRGYCGSADYVLADGGEVAVLDVKTGFGEVTPAERNPQLLLLALAAASHHGTKDARVGLLFAPEEGKPRVEWATVTADDLRSFARRLDVLAARLRATHDNPQRVDLGAVHPGTPCRYCPARAACPEMARREKEALAVPQQQRLVVTTENAGEVWAAVDRAKGVLDELKTACIQVALANGGVRMPDGKTRRQVSHEVEALEAQAVWEALAARWGAEVAKAGVGIDASKASVGRAVKAARAAGAPGTAAQLTREVLDAVRQRGGVGTKTRTEWVDE